MERAETDPERRGAPEEARKWPHEAGEICAASQLRQGGVIPAAEEGVQEGERRKTEQDADEENDHAGYLFALPDQARQPAQDNIVDRAGQQRRAERLPEIEALAETHL